MIYPNNESFIDDHQDLDQLLSGVEPTSQIAPLSGSIQPEETVELSNSTRKLDYESVIRVQKVRDAFSASQTESLILHLITHRDSNKLRIVRERFEGDPKDSTDGIVLDCGDNELYYLIVNKRLDAFVYKLDFVSDVETAQAVQMGEAVRLNRDEIAGNGVVPETLLGSFRLKRLELVGRTLDRIVELKVVFEDSTRCRWATFKVKIDGAVEVVAYLGQWVTQTLSYLSITGDHPRSWSYSDRQSGKISKLFFSFIFFWIL